VVAWSLWASHNFESIVMLFNDIDLMFLMILFVMFFNDTDCNVELNYITIIFGENKKKAQVLKELFKNAQNKAICVTILNYTLIELNDKVITYI
jgi:hypothetical protein